MGNSIMDIQMFFIKESNNMHKITDSYNIISRGQKMQHIKTPLKIITISEILIFRCNAADGCGKT